MKLWNFVYDKHRAVNERLERTGIYTYEGFKAYVVKYCELPLAIRMKTNGFFFAQNIFEYIYIKFVLLLNSGKLKKKYLANSL